MIQRDDTAYPIFLAPGRASLILFWNACRVTDETLQAGEGLITEGTFLYNAISLKHDTMVLGLPPIISLGILLVEMVIGFVILYKFQDSSMLAMCIISGILMLVFGLSVFILFG